MKLWSWVVGETGMFEIDWNLQLNLEELTVFDIKLLLDCTTICVKHLLFINDGWLVLLARFQ
jgi:hypothetical protein